MLLIMIINQRDNWPLGAPLEVGSPKQCVTGERVSPPPQPSQIESKPAKTLKAKILRTKTEKKLRDFLKKHTTPKNTFFGKMAYLQPGQYNDHYMFTQQTGKSFETKRLCPWVSLIIPGQFMAYFYFGIIFLSFVNLWCLRSSKMK